MSGEKSEAVAVCSTCGERLSENGDCLACLLRPALDDTVAQDPPPLLVFGDFEVARRNDGSLWELGRGGMGVTYRAVDRVLHRSVALKVIEVPRDDARNGQTVRERFLREARAAAALRHNNIAGIYHCGAVSDAGTCFYAMELVEGETLEARVRREGPLDVETALEIAIQVTAALMAAAHQGLIHRDLKPANLMLSRGEDANAPPLEVKVIDFGLAKAAASVAGELDLTHGGFVGTPAFASPEQCERGAVDARSDLYSLGVTLWYALSARVPFAGRSFEETCQLKATASLPVQQLKARNVPIPVIALVSALLARDPAERPASARELMTALQDCRRQLNAASAPAISPAALRRSRPRAALIGAGLVTVALAAAGAWWALSRTAPDRSKRAPVVIPDKSIAVLPFENLSADKDNAFFTDGVQDEILTDLAKVADLKVISRTSVMQYKSGVSRNLPEIAAQLGVANVLEGSVQRAGNQVRVNAQLIDARTDAHLWAENYDRPLDDVFAIQTEIAKTIADQLRARISPEEHAAMAEVPTRDLRALQLYQEALELENHAFDTDARALLLRAVDLLGQAISRDPKFLRAWCLLSTVHLDLYWNGFDHTEARRELARAAADEAGRLQPNAAETHDAWATYDYYALRDYEQALAELKIALRTRPNDADALATAGAIHRRQGRWDETIREWERCAELDPRNLGPIQGVAEVYTALGRYPQAARTYNRALSISPGNLAIRESLALLPYFQRADLGPSRTLNAAILAGEPEAVEASSYYRLTAALAERNAAAARAALATFPAAGWPGTDNFITPRDWFAGLVARASGDRTAAQMAFNSARAQVATIVREQPDYAQAWSALGLIDAALGRKEEAIREGTHACELLPVAKDAWEGPTLIGHLAEVYAWTGETTLALAQLERAAYLPNSSGNGSGSLYYGGLKCDPCWDPLRGDPRFEALVASLAPAS